MGCATDSTRNLQSVLARVERLLRFPGSTGETREPALRSLLILPLVYSVDLVRSFPVSRSFIFASALLFLSVASAVAQAPAPAVPTSMMQEYARDPGQPIDSAYTAAIVKDTTEPYFNSPLTNYLPASKTVPTPEAVIGDIAGAPGKLPYAEDVYKYFRLLQAHSPRVKVFTIGKSEEGRERIVAAIGDSSLLDQMSANDARLAKLADPRRSGISDEQAAALVKQSFPVYYITGTIHSTETGAPTALMELAYRLAVDNSPYIQYIRQHMVVLITPVVEVDGRDRMVDIYQWHLAHPGENWPQLLYWGHYVAHDNNRDAMALTLSLSTNVLDTFLKYHAQVLHDLHESVPFLYDNTVGDGPYNAWIDPMLSDEWASLGWNNVAQMQNFGMPGAFTHGDFDTWSPGYLMFLATLHNGISRLYETFGNGGADTERRILSPDEYSRTWFRQNPPIPSVMWSQRDNNNYEETALLSTLSYFVQNRERFLDDYYVKAKRSEDKPNEAGPAAYVLSADPAYADRQLALLRVLARQHVEVSQLTAPATVNVTVSDHAAAMNKNLSRPAAPAASASGIVGSSGAAASAAMVSETFPAGSWVIRMDQPFSRVADALLDRQYWSPTDPQKTPYDDTAWCFSELFNADVTRVTDSAILKDEMQPVENIEATGEASVTGTGGIVAIENTGQLGLLGAAYALPGAKLSVLDKQFSGNGVSLHAGSLLIEDADRTTLENVLQRMGLKAQSMSALPSYTHASEHLPRIAFIHTWFDTQTEGWWRLAFDDLKIPYSYISTQTASADPDLRSKYDVIIFAPLSGDTSAGRIVDGLPMYGNPVPWEKTALTPNIGRIDSTADMRPGLGETGVTHLRAFVEHGGLLITSEDTARFAIDEGLAPGVSVAAAKNVRVVGSILGALPVDANSPVMRGYVGTLPVYSQSGMAFDVSDTFAGGNPLPTQKDTHRVTGRGGPEDDDLPEARTPETIPTLPDPKPWQATPLNEDQARNNPYLIPKAMRPDVLLRFADAKQLLLSGLLDNPEPIAEHAAVVDAHLGQGNVLLFAINPVYRGETIGTYGLVFNAILNYDQLAHAPETSKAK